MGGGESHRLNSKTNTGSQKGLKLSDIDKTVELESKECPIDNVRQERREDPALEGGWGGGG